MNAFFATILLTALVALCLLGLLHPQYNDNIGHCVGMVVVLLWAVAQLLRLHSLRYMPTDDVFVAFGLFSFGAGTAVRTWLYKRKKR
jgi:hypothetical protein